MLFSKELKSDVLKAVSALYNSDFPPEKISLQPTNKEFAGDATLVVFPFLKISRQSPEETAQSIGEWMKNNSGLVRDFNVIKGFLNLSIKNDAYIKAFINQGEIEPKEGEIVNPILVEYSSPNTNKPLHLGHIRNNLIGYSLAEILKADGNLVYKVSIINDRGIHICKSMLAWQKFGNGETPASSGMKGDHLVGKYYVEFDRHYNMQALRIMEEWKEGRFESDDVREKYQKLNDLAAAKNGEARAGIAGELKDLAKSITPVFKEVQQMLRNWEAGDKDTIELWNKMNSWVYEGFDETYKKLGVDFDKIYYESQTYLFGKTIVEEGLQKGIFFKKEDGSVWVDLKEEGLDEKLLLRGDGTAVYITQDLGTAKLRYDDYHFSKLIFVVGNEQQYHFKVLKLTLKKLGYAWWDKLHHMAYNMVDLPEGKMKSREGTVVDADDLIDATTGDAEKMTRQLGKLSDFESEESKNLYRIIGLGALKYFILKVDPEKRMLFNPVESIDINGNTGPFVQYTYARIQSVLRKARSMEAFAAHFNDSKIDLLNIQVAGLNEKEKDIIKSVLAYNEILSESAGRLSPALIAQYSYDLAKVYNQFYNDNVVVDAAQFPTSVFRILLSQQTGMAIKKAFTLLGIEVPDQM